MLQRCALVAEASVLQKYACMAVGLPCNRSMPVWLMAFHVTEVCLYGCCFFLVTEVCADSACTMLQCRGCMFFMTGRVLTSPIRPLLLRRSLWGLCDTL